MIDLRHGDCLELMKDIPDKSIDCIITDPPYGTMSCKWDSVIPFDKMWKQLNRIIKNNGAIVLFGSEPFSSMLRCSNLKNYKYDWIWKKQKAGSFAVGKYRPLGYHENISVFGYDKINYYPQMIPRKSNRVKQAHESNYKGFSTSANDPNPPSNDSFQLGRTELYFDHVYTVTSIEGDYVYLRNPHDSKTPMKVNMKKLFKMANTEMTNAQGSTEAKFYVTFSQVKL